jgi:ribosome-associated heat shock protein Hsp15
LDRQRIDKWLWHARMVRTRGDAAALVEAGHARLNGHRVTAPGQALRLGDVVTLALDRSVRVIEVAGFCERRGAPDSAKATYRDLAPRPAAKACAFSGIARKFRPA